MIVHAVAPEPQCIGLLEGTTFADAFRFQTGEPGLDAITATRRVMERVPGWITILLAVRNALVAPFGLKGADRRADVPKMGAFPVISQSPGRVVLGFNDKHLDFRLVVDAPGDGAIVGTTLIRTHNLLGRTYLAMVLPFHRVIVPAMLRRAVGRA